MHQTLRGSYAARQGHARATAGAKLGDTPVVLVAALVHCAQWASCSGSGRPKLNPQCAFFPFSGALSPLRVSSLNLFSMFSNLLGTLPTH